MDLAHLSAATALVHYFILLVAVVVVVVVVNVDPAPVPLCYRCSLGSMVTERICCRTRCTGRALRTRWYQTFQR